MCQMATREQEPAKRMMRLVAGTRIMTKYDNSSKIREGQSLPGDKGIRRP